VKNIITEVNNTIYDETRTKILDNVGNQSWFSAHCQIRWEVEHKIEDRVWLQIQDKISFSN
jgi:hypothetical protein